jgi:hypothetical protein
MLHSTSGLIILLELFTCISTAAPVATSINSTRSHDFVGYVSEPNVRGTASLLLSCVLTLVLCVWSALHLNVPQYDARRITCLLCNIRWIITGVYAPELVVFTAWRQWASARLLGKLVTELSEKSEKNKQPRPQTTQPIIVRKQQTTSLTGSLYTSSTFADRRNEWTKAHDFFASTGGFALKYQLAAVEPGFYPRLVHPASLSQLAESPCLQNATDYQMSQRETSWIKARLAIWPRHWW